MPKQLTLNPITGNFDLVSADVVVVSTAPSTGDEGTFYQVEDDPTAIYYFLGVHRYKIEAVEDDPAAGGAGTPMGLLLALTYSA